MIPLLIGYSETHFRFGGISPSFLFRRDPEIIVDMPARLAPGTDLPVMLLINDIHRFPVEVESVNLHLTAQGKRAETITFDTPADYEEEHHFSFRAKLFHFTLKKELLSEGWNTIHAAVTVRRNGKTKVIQNDNLVTASHRPFSVFVAKEDFPGIEAVSFGDMHTHSIHSNSHVEFGAPLSTVQKMGKATGMQFTAVTDHSYDLECDPQNYLKRDSSLENWKTQQRFENSFDGFTLLTGQEISGRRTIGGVVHLGALGHRSFIHGSGDGARWGYRRFSEPSLQEAAQQVIDEGGITFAAHPGEKTSLFHRIMLRRGNWVQKELTENVTALQAINGSFDSFWYVARKLWVDALLSRKKIPLIAGNDAHGDFNRYRAIGFPFLYIKENFHRYFGLARTGLYTTDYSKGNILETIREGRTFITDGAYLNILAHNESCVGGTVESSEKLTVVAKSSPEFGYISVVRFIAGHCSEGRETVWLLPVKQGDYSFHFEIPEEKLAGADYIRVELETEPGDRHFPTKAATSPVYIA